MTATANTSRLHTFFSWTLGPMYVGTAIAMFCLLHTYLSANSFAVYLILNVSIILMTQLLEWVLPYEKKWRKPDDQFVNEVGSTFISAMIGHKLGRGLAFACFGWLLTWSRELGGGAAPWWPTSLPFAAQVILAAIIWEFGLYWNHRFMHGWAWRFHSMHHKLRRLSWINSGYGHPMNFLLTSLFGYSVLAITGAPADVLLFNWYLAMAINFLSHANADLKMGYLNLILNTPELHRWHHVREPESSGRNFGTQLIVWDLVFGTYYLPKDRLPSRNLGSDTPVPAGFFAQWMAPFFWKKSAEWKPAIPDQRMPFHLSRRSEEKPGALAARGAGGPIVRGGVENPA